MSICELLLNTNKVWVERELKPELEYFIENVPNELEKHYDGDGIPHSYECNIHK